MSRAVSRRMVGQYHRKGAPHPATSDPSKSHYRRSEHFHTIQGPPPSIAVIGRGYRGSPRCPIGPIRLHPTVICGRSISDAWVALGRGDAGVSTRFAPGSQSARSASSRSSDSSCTRTRRRANTRCDRISPSASGSSRRCLLCAHEDRSGHSSVGGWFFAHSAQSANASARRTPASPAIRRDFVCGLTP